jgi:outer membrane protein OmpA-like peptidoglycan-associated protein
MKNPISLRLSQAFALPVLATLLAAACATAAPVELRNARVAYTRASAGPAAQQTPADLHKAKAALDKAEQSFSARADAQTTVDLAYIAERTAQIAEARAQTAIAENTRNKATQELGDTRGNIAKKNEADLVSARAQLGEAERGQAQQTERAGVERAAREDADRRAAASAQVAKDANEALAKLAAKEEERGMVITLSGSVLFRSNDAMLLPAAQTRLDQVADALMARKRDVLVEGHTDSKGSQATNMSLSQRRAESVRSYLVSRGFPAEQIQARGIGSDRPIADNNNAEGRANNRRVEIVIAKKSTATN